MSGIGLERLVQNWDDSRWQSRGAWPGILWTLGSAESPCDRSLGCVSAPAAQARLDSHGTFGTRMPVPAEDPIEPRGPPVSARRSTISLIDMPRTPRFDDRDLSHQQALRMVTAWLRRQMKSPAASPLDLAQKHLGEHGEIKHRQCRLCGAAWAIIHCESGLREEIGHRLIEALVASRERLKLPWSCLYGAAAKYVDAKRNRKHKTMGDSSPDKPGARKISKEDIPLLFLEIRRVLVGFRQLFRMMREAEASLAGRFTTPALGENPGRRPRDYLRTTIDCYLFRHGWTVPEIYSLYHPKRVPSPHFCRHLYDRVERARKTGHPPLIGGWPSCGKRASRSRSRLLTRSASA